ncbi:MAG: hypothetical protein WDN75_13375 [Bacteroidota bacterium]
MIRALFLFLAITLLTNPVCSQNNIIQEVPDTLAKSDQHLAGQKDVIDILARFIKSPGAAKHNAVVAKKEKGRIHVTVAPGIGYTLSTGFAAILASYAAFYTSETPGRKAV